MGLHAPMLLIDSLLKAQQFDDALKVCHYIFDPNSPGPAGNQKYWQFPPFKSLANTDAKQTLEQMFLQLQPRQKDDNVTIWCNNPFSPHAVARTRPVAYMKWVTMKYIEILIAYGDYYFRQNSLETIPDAIQCYVMASHVYGPRAQMIPKRGKTAPATYSSLLDRWDAFGNAIVQLEVAFPFSNQTQLPIGSSNGITGFANIFGFATSLYFCIPPNPKLKKLRDTIDDRFYKIPTPGRAAKSALRSDLQNRIQQCERELNTVKEIFRTTLDIRNYQHNQGDSFFTCRMLRLKTHFTDTKRKQVLEWLRPGRFDGRHAEIRESRTENTGNWIVDALEAYHWTTEKGLLLVGTGDRTCMIGLGGYQDAKRQLHIAGIGKTYLWYEPSTIVDDFCDK
jgi:hypothetical protein